MDKTEALRTLGLDDSATEEDVKAAFRRLVRQAHPDTGGGQPADVQRLEEARDAALDPGTALIPVNQMKDLILATQQPLQRQLERQERQAEREAIFKQVVRAQTSRLKQAQRDRTAFAGLAAGAAAISQVIRALPLSYTGTKNASTIAVGLLAAFGLLAAMLALLAWRASQRVRLIEEAVDDANDTLSSRPSFVATLHEITSESEATAWTAEELTELIYSWSAGRRMREAVPMGYLIGRGEPLPLSALAGQIGPADFLKLLLAKGRELELLNVEESWDGAHLIERYSLRVPSR